MIKEWRRLKRTAKTNKIQILPTFGKQSAEHSNPGRLPTGPGTGLLVPASQNNIQTGNGNGNMKK